MATITENPIVGATRLDRRKVGPEHHGLAMSFDEFASADFIEGWLYELAREIVVVTELPGIVHEMIVGRLANLFDGVGVVHPGIIKYRAGVGHCRLRLPGLKSDRRMDQAIYLF